MEIREGKFCFLEGYAIEELSGQTVPGNITDEEPRIVRIKFADIDQFHTDPQLEKPSTLLITPESEHNGSVRVIDGLDGHFSSDNG